MFLLPKQYVCRIDLQSCIPIFPITFLCPNLGLPSSMVYLFKDQLGVYAFESLMRRTKKLFEKITLKHFKFGPQCENFFQSKFKQLI